jgi:uncharacterized membrane protein YfcA
MLLIFLIGIVASLISGAIGGGSGLILTPVQMIVGIDPKIATTTTHFGFIGVSLGAMMRFTQERNLRHQHAVPLACLAFVSGFLGPYLNLFTGSTVFQQIVGGLILVCIPLFIFKSNLGADKRHASVASIMLGYLAFLLILIMQVAFGAATGILAIFVAVYLFGLSMIEASAVLRLPNLISSLMGLMVYAQLGKVNYESGLTLLIATMVGGYIGSHIAIKGGNRFVKHLFSAFAVILAVMLLFR